MVRDPKPETTAPSTGQIRPPLPPLIGPADFLLLRPHAHELALGDRRAGLVYAASGSVVETTVVAGRVLMRGGIVPDADEVIARAVERAERLGLR